MNISITVMKRISANILDALFVRSGRYWSLACLIVLFAGCTLCLFLRPELFRHDAALSSMGGDPRTVWVFGITMCLAAYLGWRWRGYLASSTNNRSPVMNLHYLVLLALFLIGVTPLSWDGIIYDAHRFSTVLLGFSMLALVITDTAYGKPASASAARWYGIRAASVAIIMCGAIVTLGWVVDAPIIGEYSMLFGHSIWVIGMTFPRLTTVASKAQYQQIVQTA